MTYFIELSGKWPKSQRRILEIVGWAIAQQHVDDPLKEIWFTGGGPVQRGVPWVKDAKEVYWDLGEPYLERTVKFVQNNHYAAVFPRREKAEEIAMLLGLENPILMGRMYLSGVTRLGPVSRAAKLLQKPRRP